MENIQIQLASEQVEIMEVAPTGEMKKKINILDMKLAIRPLKTQIDHLFFFLKFYEIVLKCKQERSVSTLWMYDFFVLYVMHWECNFEV